MKDWEYNVTLVLSVCCLVLAVWIIGAGRANERMQAQLQAQQIDIERGNMARQYGSRIVQDMMTSGSTNKAMRVMLEKYGFVPQAIEHSASIKKEKTVSSPVKAKDKNLKSSAGK